MISTKKQRTAKVNGIVTVYREEFGTASPPLNQVGRRGPQYPYQLREVRTGRVPFAVGIIAVEQMLSFEEIPNLRGGNQCDSQVLGQTLGKNPP
jgi:hypothetical protein